MIKVSVSIGRILRLVLRNGRRIRLHILLGSEPDLLSIPFVVIVGERFLARRSKSLQLHIQ